MLDGLSDTAQDRVEATAEDVNWLVDLHLTSLSLDNVWGFGQDSRDFLSTQTPHDIDSP